MGCFEKLKTVVVAAALVVAIMSAEAQDVPSCAAGLTSCTPYLNATTKPPALCCDPLKEAVNKQLKCLCDLYSQTDLLKSFGINATEAQRLPTLCGVPGNLCQGGNNTSSPSVPASGSPKDNDSSPKNDSGRLGILSGLLIWASLMLW